jgi:ubiquitin carboxyl-terminal hydrolase 2
MSARYKYVIVCLVQCFMNSVLQCLSHTKPLLLFCLQSNLAEYLNTSNTSVMKGVLMQGVSIDDSMNTLISSDRHLEYARLISQMWSSSQDRSAVSPISFKNTIGKFAPRFTGYSYVNVSLLCIMIIVQLSNFFQ